MKISPKFGPDKLTGLIEDYIDIYEDRLQGWMFDRAGDMLRHPDGGFAALAISLSFFEQHSIFMRGESSKDHSREFFVQAFKHVFWEHHPGPGMDKAGIPSDFTDRLANFMYVKARCGLFHQAMARSGVMLGNYKDPMNASVNRVTGEIDAVMINPRTFLDSVQEDQAKYIVKVRNPKEQVLRDKFLAAWKLTHAGEILHLPQDPPEPSIWARR